MAENHLSEVIFMFCIKVDNMLENFIFIIGLER
jgi:hypothetical protein